ncbi:DUF5709 domain-containing protein [Mycolicibacterium monacense]|uniref:DUF5709 domain-containing protein n=1 Tax=Mycolicibacterium monacense TaxID=85693 RepID=A0AAD1IWJ9_MYCMB|nr:DUF5709 domain-containing protein [Mycolicibacterium monacense]MDA4101331.1 hypothetical protein [Mycolicibacterium monacense DSM 44395]OBB64991.1 hypothetical protein A6B34_01720 [Mycolicibacterium monacense]ORB20791.1 hypothetical protein BST34_11320 [Mycolicibacterium monacense DSM 44395]QHP84923.1 hypothetical protein EWR22_05810 [Mycolicibacterium monacense DSM 44395]BBZ62261.1 hypothetical protein MMON_35620 [Mycolicibacterium monacense]
MTTDPFRYVTGPAAGEYSGEEEDQLPAEDTLVDRAGVDPLDEGYSPPERPYAPGAFGPGETLDQKLAEEEPETADLLDETERDVEFPRRDEVGGRRAGRLLAPDQGFGEDTEADLVAEDVGIDGAAASAEEAAVHVIDEDEETEED